MIHITVPLIILMLYLLVLYCVSRYDYRHMQVKLNEGLLLVLLGGFYLLMATGLYIETVISLVLLLMIFGIPCLFGFGLGDLLVFVSLAPFLAPGNIIWYLGVFFITWILWHALMVHKNVREGRLQGYRASLSKQAIITLQYPLIPVIFISFLLWLFLQQLMSFYTSIV